MNHPPKSVLITLVIISLNAAFWFIYALIVAFGNIRSFAALGIGKWIMIVLALGSSLALVGVVIFLRRHNRSAYYFALILLAIISVLSITDDFGFLDLFSLLISIIPFGLMIKDRTWYLQ
jgi:hypothetical protein